MDEDKVKKLIQQEMGKQFSTRIVGDTPTDALQLAPKKYVNNYVFYGAGNGDGTAAYFPTGWTVQRTPIGASNGNYQITHNLNTTKYGVVATADNTGLFGAGQVACVNTVTSTTFIIQTVRSDNGVNTDSPYFFVVIKRP